MKINIRNIAFTLRKEVGDRIQNKVKKLACFCSEIIGIEVSLKVDKSTKNKNKTCNIRLVVPGYDLLSGARHETFEGATAQAVEALERQIERRKTRLISTRVRKHSLNDNELSFF
jgi:ribosomal subunit interface protein